MCLSGPLIRSDGRVRVARTLAAQTALSPREKVEELDVRIDGEADEVLS